MTWTLSITLCSSSEADAGHGGLYSAPRAAANNLNQAVHAERKALGAEAISLREGLLRLAAELDVEEFELAGSRMRPRTSFRQASSEAHGSTAKLG